MNYLTHHLGTLDIHVGPAVGVFFTSLIPVPLIVASLEQHGMENFGWTLGCFVAGLIAQLITWYQTRKERVKISETKAVVCDAKTAAESAATEAKQVVQNAVVTAKTEAVAAVQQVVQGVKNDVRSNTSDIQKLQTGQESRDVAQAGRDAEQVKRLEDYPPK